MSQLNNRNIHIDILRGIAIFLVLLLHFNIAYHLDQSALSKIFSINFIKNLSGNGNYGVTLFFVISGFLITKTSLDRYHKLSAIDISNFYVFRFARIMPCLLLVLSFIVFFNFFHITIFQNEKNNVSLSLAILSVLTFWHNILMEKVGYFNYCLNIFWSLSVEEIFYLIFPVMCLMFKKLRFIMLFFIALIIISPLVRNYYANNEIVALYGYFSCFDAIAIGCVATIISRNIRLKERTKYLFFYGSSLCMVGIYFYDGIMENISIDVSLMAVVAAFYLMSVNDDEMKKIQPNLFVRCIIWLGNNSYELYLFHIIVLALMKEMISPNMLNSYTKLLWMVAFFILSALLAGIISNFYSQPLNKKIREYSFGYRQQYGNFSLLNKNPGRAETIQQHK